MLPYSSNIYGSTPEPLNYSLVRKRISDGSVSSTDTVGEMIKQHVRTGKSTNRRRPIAGTSTPWIPPSSYARHQHEVRYLDRANLKVARFWYHEDAPCNTSMMAGAWPYRDRGLLHWWEGHTMGNMPNKSSLPLIAASNMAKTKALNDLAGAKANLGEALATVRQTADMFVDTVIPLLKYIRSFRRNIVNDLASFNPARVYDAVASGRLNKTIANRWLEFHYGWKPLASDVYGIYELLNEQLNAPRALLVHGRGSASYEDQANCTCPGSALRTGVNFSANANVQFRSNVTGAVQSSPIARAVNQAGMVNPALLVWELIPFSFVIDWVTPVGSVLSALSASAGLNFIGGHETMRFGRLVHAVTHVDSSVDKRSANTFIESTGFERTRYTGFPYPAPYIKPFYTGGDRWATVISLFNGLASGKVKQLSRI